MAFFDVFVEGPRDDSAGGRSMLANRIARRFSLDPQAVAELISKGRFRVKNRVSDELARKLGTELQDLGAVVSIVDAEGQPPATPDESAMSLKFRLGELDATALVALDGSAAQKTEMPEEAFAPPDDPSVLDEEDLVELADPEVLKPRPMAPFIPDNAPPPPPEVAAPSAKRPARPGGSAMLAQGSDGRLAFLQGLRDRPVVHAAVGLVLAIVLGYIPACLYTDHVRRHEIRPLRQEEVLLTHRPPAGAQRTATQAREDIVSIKWREFFVCLGIWLVVGGAGAWSYFRLT